MNAYDYFVKHVYNTVKLDCEGMDAIYEDHLRGMFGIYGLNALLVNKLIESCGVINGRQLYVLCPYEFEKFKDYEDLVEENKKLKEMIIKGI